MKFIATLAFTLIMFYFGLDYFLSKNAKESAEFKASSEGALVTGMANFLENNPEMNKKFSGSSAADSPTTPIQATNATTNLNYLGNTPTDLFLKSFIQKKTAIKQGDFESETRLFVELSDYIQAHPKEAIERIEGALQSVPSERKEEKEALKVAFIHSAIYFLDEIEGEETTKKAYYKRFVEQNQDPDIRDALETHFPQYASPN